jgi:hypothetical protein
MKIVTYNSNMCMTLLKVTPHYGQPKVTSLAAIIFVQLNEEML